MVLHFQRNSKSLCVCVWERERERESESERERGLPRFSTRWDRYSSSLTFSIWPPGAPLVLRSDGVTCILCWLLTPIDRRVWKLPSLSIFLTPTYFIPRNSRGIFLYLLFTVRHSGTFYFWNPHNLSCQKSLCWKQWCASCEYFRCTKWQLYFHFREWVFPQNFWRNHPTSLY